MGGAYVCLISACTTISSSKHFTGSPFRAASTRHARRQWNIYPSIDSVKFPQMSLSRGVGHHHEIFCAVRVVETDLSTNREC